MTDTLSRWLDGTPLAELGPDAESELRAEFDRLAEVGVEGIALFCAMSVEAENHVKALDGAWSSDPHTRGYNAGKQTQLQRTQQATAHAANYLRRLAGG